MVKRLGIWIVLIGVWGCESQSPPIAPRPPRPSLTPVVTATPTPAPPLVKLSLALDQLEDLKVKQGDFVFKGQILVDRGSVYQKLRQERQLLQQQLTLLNSTVVLPPQLTNNKVEAAAVQQARERLQQAEAAIASFKQNSPYTDLALKQLPLPEEEARLAQLELERRQAQINLEQAIAQLDAAKTVKPSPAPQDPAVEKAKLEAQIAAIAEQLQEPELIQSPHTGTIKTLKTESQPTGQLKAELFFVIEAQPSLPQTGVPTLPSSPQLPGLPSPPSSPQPQGLPTLPPPLPN